MPLENNAPDITTTPYNYDTTNTPIAGQLQPLPAPSPISMQQQQARGPAQQPTMIQEDRQPGGFFHKISHAFAGAIIGSLAGDGPYDYRVDDSGRNST